MKAIITSFAAAVVVIAGAAAPAYATTITSNVGAVIKTGNTSSNVEVSKNVGAVVKTSGTGSATVVGNVGAVINVKSCGDSGVVAKNNVGAVIKVDGQQCDAQALVDSLDIKGNVGSVITISNVCGTSTPVIAKNVGAVIKVTSTGPCTPKTATPENPVTVPPTTVVVETPKVVEAVKTTEKTATVVKTTATGNGNLPAEMPQTGANELTAYLAGGAGILTYVALMVIRARRA